MVYLFADIEIGYQRPIGHPPLENVGITNHLLSHQQTITKRFFANYAIAHYVIELYRRLLI